MKNAPNHASSQGAFVQQPRLSTRPEEYSSHSCILHELCGEAVPAPNVTVLIGDPQANPPTLLHVCDSCAQAIKTRYIQEDRKITRTVRRILAVEYQIEHPKKHQDGECALHKLCGEASVGPYEWLFIRIPGDWPPAVQLCDSCFSNIANESARCTGGITS
jgi:hypothetical protein